MKSSDNRSAADVAVISLLSRGLTLLGKTMYMAMFGATHPLLNAFTFALNLPQILFTMVGTAINSVMIPVYSSLLAEEREDEAKKFIDNIITISMALISVLVVLGMFAAPFITDLVAVPYASDGHSEFLTFALRFLMPAMIFFGFGAIFQGLLQANGVFRLPALITVPGGVILIVYLVFFGEQFGVEGLLFATALGFLTQPLIMLYAMRKIGYRYSFAFDLKNPHIRKAALLNIPVFISVSSYQLNFLFSNGMAVRFGAAAIVSYSQMLVQVFVLTIVYAVISVYFPKLSALYAKADTKGYLDSFRHAVLYITFTVLPVTGGFFLLRYDIMAFLLNWQDDSLVYADILLAGNLLGLYAIGIIAISFQEMANRAFYSFKDPKKPALFSVIMMIVNICLILALVPVMGVYSIPIAFAAAAIVGGGGLMFLLERKIKFINRKLVIEVCKNILAASFMVLVVAIVQRFELVGLLNILLSAFVGAVVYFVSAYFLGIEVLRELIKR